MTVDFIYTWNAGGSISTQKIEICRTGNVMIRCGTALNHGTHVTRDCRHSTARPKLRHIWDWSKKKTTTEGGSCGRHKQIKNYSDTDR